MFITLSATLVIAYWVVYWLVTTGDVEGDEVD
jgi:hypothetical protein